MKYKLFIGQPWFGRISSNKQGPEQKKVTWRRKKVKVNWQRKRWKTFLYQNSWAYVQNSTIRR